MQAAVQEVTRPAVRSTTQRYATCIEASKRIRWDIDRDVFRGRQFDFGKKFLPDGLSKAGIEIADRMPLETPINADNRRYMTAKATRGGHKLGHVIAALAEMPESDTKATRLVP